jgi:hypothetical protein
MRIYRALLRLYPRDYQARFGAEILGMLESSPEGFSFREAAGLIAGALRERQATPVIRNRTHLQQMIAAIERRDFESARMHSIEDLRERGIAR